MSRIVPIEEPVIPAEYASWHNKREFTSQGTKCTFENREYEVISKKVKLGNDSVGKVCLAVAAIFFTCGLILLSDRFNKWLGKAPAVRFAIPTQKINELKEKPKDGEVLDKINNLNAFYAAHFIATKNSNVIVEIVENCLEASKTFKELENVDAYMSSCHVLNNDFKTRAKGTIQEKLIQFGAKEGPLYSVMALIEKWQINDEGLNKLVAERILTEKSGRWTDGFNLGNQRLDRYAKCLTEDFDFASEPGKYSASPLAYFLPSRNQPAQNMKLATKAAELIFKHCDASDPALKKASYFAIANSSSFKDDQLEKAVGVIITDKQRFTDESLSFKFCLMYLGINKAKFSTELKIEAHLHYQALPKHNKDAVLDDLMSKLFVV